MTEIAIYQLNLPINKNIIQIKPSATLVINKRSNALLEAGKKVIKLGFGQSPFQKDYLVLLQVIFCPNVARIPFKRLIVK